MVEPWEIILCLLTIAAAAVPLACATRRWPWGGRAALLLAAAALLVTAVNWAVTRATRGGHREFVPAQTADRGFRSSKSCASCHPQNYASWHATYHRTMTQLAGPDTVRAPFENVVLEDRGRKYYLFRQGDEYWAHMPDQDWEARQQYEHGVNLSEVSDPPMATRRIVMTTGSHHLQGYWVNGEGNQLRQFPWYYRIREQRWIPRHAAFLAPTIDLQYFPVWNRACIKCHAVAGVPGVDHARRVLNSKVVELGIGCESCHGPAEEHVRVHQNPAHRYRQRLSHAADDTIVNPARCSPQVASQICGQCHSARDVVDVDEFLERGFPYRAGGEFSASFELPRVEGEAAGDGYWHDSFWADGTCRVGGDEYNAMIVSACFQEGSGNRQLSCLSCHSMHASHPNDQLADGMQGDEACLQCHAGFRERVAEHTHHAPGSSGSRCYNCHMPHTSYALYTAMRSHRVDSPDIASSARTGRPNACNLCHLDQTLAWSAEHLREWYGAPQAPLDDRQQQVAASVLWLLQGDAVQRAVAAWHMGWEPALEASGGNWQAPLLAQLLDDPYIAVRFLAEQSLRRLPGFERFRYDYLGPAADRAAARQAALRIWSSAAWHPGATNFAALPVDTERRLDEALLRQLAAQRDDTPVQVPE